MAGVAAGEEGTRLDRVVFIPGVAAADSVLAAEAALAGSAVAAASVPAEAVPAAAGKIAKEGNPNGHVKAPVKLYPSAFHVALGGFASGS